jgi:hypothetical protein
MSIAGKVLVYFRVYTEELHAVVDDGDSQGGTGICCIIPMLLKLWNTQNSSAQIDREAWH